MYNAGTYSPRGAINPNFYTAKETSCIYSYFNKYFAGLAVGNYAPLARLAFHDAIAGAPNGSLQKFLVERANQPTLSGYNITNALRTGVMGNCSIPMSYADTLVLASAAATTATGGPSIESFNLTLGRTDATVPDNHMLLPSAYYTNVPNYEKWREFNSLSRTLWPSLVVTPLAKHTVTHSLSVSLQPMVCWSTRPMLCLSIQHLPGIGPRDANGVLTYNASVPTNDQPQVYLDDTPNTWDNNYYQNLLVYRGVLLSDESMFADRHGLLACRICVGVPQHR
eukprot:jgi/Chrzof1/5308/Cz15g21190.t1